jgi:diacylglycerol kinase (ATP)
MNKTGVIINPKSGRGRGKGVALAEALKHQSTDDVDVVMLNTFQDLYPGLERLAANNVTSIFISSGDGTIQAIQTWIAESGRFKTLPRLCLLPHGTTNMTAADLGFRRKSIAEQANFISNIETKEQRSRHTVRVVNPKGRGPLHGMFFGTGAVAEATRYCQVAFNDKGVGGNLATFATLASALGKTMFFKSNVNDPDRFDKPYDITLKINGTPQCQGPQLMMLATTLGKLILGTKPFWGGATAPLRTMTMPYPVPNIPRWILPVMFGSEDRKAPPGSTSIACTTCDVTSPTTFVIDGEFYDAPENAALRLEAGPQLDYIVA